MQEYFQNALADASADAFAEGLVSSAEWQHTERSEMITYQIAMRLAVLEKEAREHTPDKVLVETDQVKLVPEMSSDKIACPIQSRVAEA